MDVKRLLEEATPLPWYEHRQDEPHFGDPWRVMAPNNGLIATVHWRVRDEGEPDAALIVYAVNHLPDYEAAVELMARYQSGHNFGISTAECACAMCEKSRGILARLREKAPA